MNQHTDSGSGRPQAMEPSHAPQLHCDLTSSNTFPNERHGYGPPVPILAAFGSGEIHRCRMTGKWDLQKAVDERFGTLIQSNRKVISSGALDKWEELLFRCDERTFLHTYESWIIGYAPSIEKAGRIVQEFNDSYAKSSSHAGGHFQLIRRENFCDIKCEQVSLGRETMLSEEQLALFYPKETQDWHPRFVEKLCGRKNGLSILEGEPGTGKTTYLRHLMGVLKGTHRFYFIPPYDLELIADPEFVGFWSNELSAHPDDQFVVILEDADAALLPRGADNRGQVTAILNLSDGMLADFLRMHVVCTINCRFTEIDPALVRPGRLTSHHIFGRLCAAQAASLAESLGKSLPDPRAYSLAEIFAEELPEYEIRQPLGFSSH